MGSLGNSAAVKQGNARERRPASRSNSSLEAAEAPAAETPERVAKKPPVRALSEREEFDKRLRASIPGISEDALDELARLFLRG